MRGPSLHNPPGAVRPHPRHLGPFPVTHPKSQAMLVINARYQVLNAPAKTAATVRWSLVPGHYSLVPDSLPNHGRDGVAIDRLDDASVGDNGRD